MKFPQVKASCRPQSGSPRSAAPDWSIRSIGAYPPVRGKAARVGFRILFTAWIAALLLLANGCAKDPPEAALRATIATMQQAAEARDAAALVASVSEDFAGPEGMDRDQFRRYLAVIWLRNREVGVRLGPLDVELIGDRARVEFTAATTGGEGWMPERAQVHKVSTGWRMEGGDWKLISATWDPAL